MFTFRNTCIFASTDGATVRYWRKPDKTSEVFHIDEHGQLWFRSGDIGALDEQNFVYILDRAKDIIIRGRVELTSVPGPPGSLQKTGNDRWREYLVRGGGAGAERDAQRV